MVSVSKDEYDDQKVTLDIDFVDFGDCETKDLKDVYGLKTEFLKLNFQAIECRMANITPR